jgi:hypothetical protein
MDAENIGVDMNDVTIASSAMLVDLSIRGWTGKKQDREVSDEVGQNKGATTANAGVYQKNLLAGSQELININKYGSIIRAWHASRTLPWSDSGTRLLPAISFERYMKELGEHEDHYKSLVSAFVQAYSLLIQSAQFSLGALFKHSDYPDPSEIPAKFELRYATYPLPTAGDFRVDIGTEGLNILREQFARRQEERVAEAMAEVRDRIKTSLTKISNQLRIEESGTKGRIHESTIESAIELCDALDGFNLVKDPELGQLKKEMQMVLSGLDANDLRKDDVVRGYCKEEVDALLDKFNFV